MRPNPTLAELTAANQRSQKNESDALDDVGLSRSEALDRVGEVDDLDGVKLASLSFYYGKPMGCARLRDANQSATYAAIEALGYVVRIDDDANDRTRTLYFDIDARRCPKCGSSNLKEGAIPDPTRPFSEADFGCRACRNLFDVGGD